MTSGADAGNALENAIVALQKSNDNITALINKLRYWPQSATSYETFTLEITQETIAILLGADPARTRALIYADSTEVYIGKRSVLSTGLAQSTGGGPGYMLSTTGNGTEYKSIDELCVIYHPSTPTPTPRFVYVLVERNVT